MVARSHTTWGERPSAFVILKSESSNKWTGKHEDFGSDLKGWLREKLPGFAIPEWVDVVQELPVSYVHELGEFVFLICFQKTSTGKIQKNILRQLANKAGKSPAKL